MSRPPSGPHLLFIIWQAPLVPLALAFTVGIVADRLWSPPAAVSLAGAGVFFFALIFSLFETNRRARTGGAGEPAAPWLTLTFLAGALLAAGAAYHHVRQHGLAEDDIALYAGVRPQPAQLVGVVDSEPLTTLASDDPLRTFPAHDQTRFDLRCRTLRSPEGERGVSGRVQVWLDGTVPDLRAGDVVELTGKLSRPDGPANPGGFDQAAALRDQGVGALLSVPASPDAILLKRRGAPVSLAGWMARLRTWGVQVLKDAIPAPYAGLAAALLLGDGSGMQRPEWDLYLRTGVVHVLAISGQHLVVLAMFLAILFRLGQVPRRQAAWWIGAVLLTYALLTGGRPPVMRAAYMVLAACLGIGLARMVLPASAFAVSWLTVALVNPADIFQPGCQLSFLAVAVLIWGTHGWQSSPDPLVELARGQRSWLVNAAADLLRWLGWLYLVNAIVWLAVSPLVALHFHTVSPAALLIGPPVVLCSSLALLSGFLVLVAAPIAWPLAEILGGLTSVFLGSCQHLAAWGSSWSWGSLWVADVPMWWAGLFYVGLMGWLTFGWLRERSRIGLALGSAWLVLGCLMLALPRPREFRCTFLAVGHGGCTVIETPDGQVLLYDVGAIAGPDLTRRHVAPFLWRRGIRRLDDVFLSHADLDHFNGLPELLQRFSVARITLTPTFAERATAGARLTQQTIQRLGTPTRIVQRGDVLTVGDVALRVLHPPGDGPPGNENARSLVLEIDHRGLKTLLTGDLEGPGLAMLLSQKPLTTTVLMAPHHGSATADNPGLAKWAKPQVVISNQGAPKAKTVSQHYEKVGARFLTTWEHGALTIRWDKQQPVVETWRTKERVELRLGEEGK